MTAKPLSSSVRDVDREIGCTELVRFLVFVIERGMLIVGCLAYLEFFGSLT